MMEFSVEDSGRGSDLHSAVHGGSSLVINERRSAGMASLASARGGPVGWVPDEPRSSCAHASWTYDSSQIARRLYSSEAGDMDEARHAMAMTPRPPGRPRTGPSRPTGASAGCLVHARESLRSA
jgi:hypothetical protein